MVNIICRERKISALQIVKSYNQNRPKALSDPDVIHYTYTGQAYTTTSRNADTLIISKALYYHESREVYAIAFVTLTMEELKQYYNYFVSDTTSFYLVDDHEIVLCSDRPGITGTHLQEEWFEKLKMRMNCVWN